MGILLRLKKFIDTVNKYYMDKVKQIVNHPLSKSVALGIIATLLLLESQVFYSGMFTGLALRELLMAFKAD